MRGDFRWLLAVKKWFLMNLLHVYELLEKAWGQRGALFIIRAVMGLLLIWMVDWVAQEVFDSRLTAMISGFSDAVNLSGVFGKIAHRVVYFIVSILAALGLFALADLLVAFAGRRVIAELRREREALQSNEQRERLRRQWEADSRNRRKAARLMMVVSRNEAEEVYQDFRPFDEEDPQRIYHVSKCYQWAVGYAWACRLALAEEFAGVGEILQETDFCAGFWDKSDKQRDSEEDKQKFFIEPGGQEAFNRWKAEQET